MSNENIATLSGAKNANLWKAAQKLEATFLTQMLKSAGLGKPASGFGGGAGEEHFASFLLDEQAKAITKSGGFGLSEQIYQSILVKENPNA